MRRLAKSLLTALGGLVAVVIGSLVVLSALYSPVYVLRCVLWLEADVADHTRFPARQVAAAEEAFDFAAPADAEASAASVRAALESDAAVGGDAEAFLAETGTQAFIVIRDDEILYERYFGDFVGDSIATSFSTAKSYVSALVGIAIEEGAIDSVDDPITDYLPELLGRDAAFGDITVRDLLDMTSGIRYEENGLPWGDDALTYYFDDLRGLALERTEIAEPAGQRWHYANHNPLLLGLILERTTGMPVADYLASRLWERTGTEFDASWSLDSEDGFEKMESGINARPIDFAKLGRLYLDGGRWDDRQVVPADWVAASTDPDAAAESTAPTGRYPADFEQDYGTISHERYWWRIARSDGTHAFSTLGNHGQFIYVDPETRLIVVRNGERYGVDAFEWFRIFDALAQEL